MTPTTAKMKKYGLPAALLAGGIALGSAFAPIGLATAQTEVPPSELPDQDSEPADRAGGHRGARHGRAAVILELLDLEPADLREAFAEGQTLAQVAEDQGITEDELVDALVAAATDRIEAAVDNGRIDQAEADERLAGLEEKVTDRVNTVPSEREGRGGHHRPRRFGIGEALAELGLDRETVHAGFAEGQTLAEIASAAGISEDQLVAAIVDRAQTHLDQAVADEKLSQDEADEKLADIEASINERINADPGDRSGRPGRPGRR